MALSVCCKINALHIYYHRRNQEIEIYTHTEGLQESPSRKWGRSRAWVSPSRLGGFGALPREKIDFRDGWRMILSLFYRRKICFLSRVRQMECS